MSVKDSSVRAGHATGRARSRAMDRGSNEAMADGRALGLSTGWTVFSYLIGGMAAYGGIGWLIGRAVHVALLFPLGMLLGLGISLGYIIYRFGKQQAQPMPAGSGTTASPEGDDR